MGRKLEREDDKFFYYDDGSKSAKGALSQSKRDAMSAEIQKSQMASAMGTSKKELQDAQTEFPDISAEFRNQPAQPQMSQATPQAVLGVPVNQPALGTVPMAQNPMAAQPVGAGTMDLTPYNRPAPKSVVTTETQEGVPIPKAELEAVQKGFEAQIEAQKKLQETAAKAQIEQAQVQEGLNRQLDMINYERSLIEEKKQQAINEFDAKYADTMNQLQNAKIDPDRFYGGSVGKRVLAGIAIALGQFGAGLQGGGRNAALDIINKAIDDDIAAQKEGIQKLGMQASLQRQFMSDIRSRFADQDQAQLVQKAAAIEMAQNKIGQITSRVTNEQTLANGLALINQLEGQKLDTLMKARQMAAGKTVVRTQTEQGGPRVSPEMYKEIREIRNDWMKSDTTKKTMALRSTVGAIQGQLALKNGNGDLASIILLAKMLDPASVVREGEIEVLRKTGGPADQLYAQYQQVMGQGSLSDEGRARLGQQANQLMADQNKVQDKFDKFYLKSIPAGIDPTMIIQFDEPEQMNIPATFKQQQPQQNRNIMRGR